MKDKSKVLKTVKRLVVVLLLIVFAGSGVRLGLIYKDYKKMEKVYDEAAAEFTKPSAAAGEAAKAQLSAPQDEQASDAADAPDEPSAPPEYAPIEVDFDKLLEVNSDVIGWIYCEDTVLNYPLLYGRDNSFYLYKDYRGEYGTGGAIFSDMKNTGNFHDSNVIFYGHHMQNQTIFAPLKHWLKQEFYDEHPIMWILTPEQDYKVELFSGHVVWAGSDTYTVFNEPTPEFEEYLLDMKNDSEFSADVELDPNAHYVMLSTCAYSFQDARTVLHGKLVPVDSAGGKSLPTEGETAPQK